MIPKNCKAENWIFCSFSSSRPRITGTLNLLKIGLSSSKKVIFVRFNDRPLKMMKNVFYFMLKALLFLEIYTFLSWLFGNVDKRLDKTFNYKIHDVTDWTTNNYNTRLPNISLNFQNQTLKTQLKFQQIYFMQPFFTFSTTKKKRFHVSKISKNYITKDYCLSTN